VAADIGNAIEEVAMAQAAGGSKSGGGRGSGKRGSGSTRKRSSGRASSARGSGSSGRSSATGADKSVEAFRDALERSVTLSRDRLQEVVDDAVKRGRMTRADANDLVSKLVTRGRQHTDGLLKDLEKLVDQAQREVTTRVKPARRRAGTAAGRAARAARDAADRPLAEADRLRRRAGGPGFPISAYDQLTAAQVKQRLGGLSKAELRKVRTREQNGKARKSVLADIDRRLA
jgi:polyhydroxyalkanoate synthesis regulator phasin